MRPQSWSNETGYQQLAISFFVQLSIRGNILCRMTTWPMKDEVAAMTYLSRIHHRCHVRTRQ